MKASVLLQLGLLGSAVAIPRHANDPVPHKVVARQAPTASAGAAATASATIDGAVAGGTAAAKAAVGITRRRDVADKVRRQQASTASAGAAATASATIDGTVAGRTAAALAAGGAARRDVEMAKTANSALVMQDIDLEMFGQTIEAMRGYVGDLQEVMNTYAMQAESVSVQDLEAAKAVIDSEQLMTDLATPLNNIKDALSDGIMRMTSSSEYRPHHGSEGVYCSGVYGVLSGGGYEDLYGIASNYQAYSEFLELLILLVETISAKRTSGVSASLYGSTTTSADNALYLLLEEILGTSLSVEEEVTQNPVSLSLADIFGLSYEVIPTHSTSIFSAIFG